MNTQDGYDWPTPHPVPPAMYKPEPPRAPRYRCGACADTGVIRYQPTLASEWNSRVERCQACGPRELLHHPV